MNALVAEMLELARPDIELTIKEELEKLPPCEGRTHPEERFGHRLEQPASYLVSIPCGDAWLACEGWVTDIGHYLWLDCECAERRHRLDEIRYTPLDLGMA